MSKKPIFGVNYPPSIFNTRRTPEDVCFDTSYFFDCLYLRNRYTKFHSLYQIGSQPSLCHYTLFTNVPLKKTVDIVLKYISTDKEITNTLTKSSLKKLILDTFSFNGKMYEQTDGVNTGGSLGPVLANIIVAEYEKVIINKLIENEIVKFYIRYVLMSLY